MTAKILPFNEWRDVLREASKKPVPTCMLMAAKENERIAENAARTRDAMAQLDDVPCDTEGA